MPISRFIFPAVLLFLFTGAVQAQKAVAPAEIGQFNGWTAYRLENDKGRSCYITTQPAGSEPASARRDPIYIFITHAPKAGKRNEISIKLGYAVKPQSGGSFEILGGEKFDLATSGEGAWLKDAAKETSAVEAMKKGKEVLVKATSKRGTLTTDRYSLTGIGKALEKIDRECAKS
ncbi:MAG: invasion associated locus B family protein [Pseudomonadota bacterium]